MRKISTHIGVYAILLLTAFYGSLSILNLKGKTASDTALIAKKAVTSATKKEQTAAQSPLPGKDNNLTTSYIVTLKPNEAIYANARADQNFFTHSAILQHYINTL